MEKSSNIIIDGINDKDANLSRLAQKSKPSAPAEEQQKTMKSSSKATTETRLDPTSSA